MEFILLARHEKSSHYTQFQYVWNLYLCGGQEVGFACLILCKEVQLGRLLVTLCPHNTVLTLKIFIQTALSSWCAYKLLHFQLQCCLVPPGLNYETAPYCLLVRHIPCAMTPVRSGPAQGQPWRLSSSPGPQWCWGRCSQVNKCLFDLSSAAPSKHRYHAAQSCTRSVLPQFLRRR